MCVVVINVIHTSGEYLGSSTVEIGGVSLVEESGRECTELKERVKHTDT